MKELLKKEVFTKEELEKIEDYFYKDEHIEELLELENEKIFEIVYLIENELGYSLIYSALRYYIWEVTIDAKCIFSESELDTYIRLFEIIQHFDLEDNGMGYVLGDYYLREGNKEKALFYYETIFKPGFDLYLYGYYYSLSRYINLLDDQKKIEVLKSLIDNTPIEGSYELDYVDTYLSLIVNLDKKSNEYLSYIEEGIKVVLPLVRDYREKNKNRNFFSDTDEERDLCELIALKMEYYVEKKEYIKAMEVYHELTKEIGRSDCTRYYHARDRFYLNMLNYMKEEYPEVEFLLDIGHKTFEVIEEIDDINDFLNKEITLKDEKGRTLKVIVDYIYEDDVNLVPILPLIEKGGKIFTGITKEGNKTYLKNRLSH